LNDIYSVNILEQSLGVSGEADLLQGFTLETFERCGLSNTEKRVPTAVANHSKLIVLG